MVIEDYDPREAICQAAQSNNVEVIILGTRGLGTIKRLKKQKKIDKLFLKNKSFFKMIECFWDQ